jgi:hypothetical protein
MDAKQPFVIVYPRGQLSELDKARLDAVGIVAIEADDPGAVQQLRLAPPFVCESIDGDAIVRAALTALASQKPETDGGSINSVGRACHQFVQALARAAQKES